MMKCKVSIRRMCVFARHGVLPQEAQTGANFYVSLQADCQVDDDAVRTDSLDGVVDYSLLTHIVREEMATTSMLLEHVAHRIASSILERCERVENIAVTVEKENPPLGVKAEGVGVTIVLDRTTYSK